jgi:Cytosol aminopeptidase family, N-terminal domain
MLLLGFLMTKLFSHRKGEFRMRTIVNHRLRRLAVAFALVALFGYCVALTLAQTTPEKSLQAPYGLRVSVKMIGPVTQTTDLQIICVLKHDPAGDKYIEAMQDFNEKLGGLLSNLRDRGEFAGDIGETLLFTPPANSIAPKQILLIGVGDESALTLDTLREAGRIAAREAVRLNAVHVSFAPTLRDQGSKRIDVGDGDGAVVEQFLLAYDTEKRLQAEGLSAADSLADLTIEAGPSFFDGAFEKVSNAVASATDEIKQRNGAPYSTIASGK